LVGVSTFGIQGNTTLGSIAFRCDEQGSSALSITLHVFADATLAEPVPISASTQAGTFTCTTGSGPQPTPTRTPTPGSGALDGDVNCDGRVDSVDSALVLQYSAGFINSLPCPQNGDVNGDGQINAIDATLILQIVAGFI
ncbi:MAG: dockerin type I repeat-containing protein, partial [Dehalococcoidia bacterium]